MIDKEKRHQEAERDSFSDEVKARIQAKSDDRCVWCGKKVFLGYKGTIDHFIPLKKGGTNDEVNLVLMCYDCNQSKGSRIFPINVAAKYLDPSSYKELGDYFEEFVSKYDYISRGNLMSSDVYEMIYIPNSLEDAENQVKRKHKKLNYKFKGSKYLLKRAYPEDQEKIVMYYVKYLKRYNLLDSIEAARENIKFWLRFGCIYYLGRNDDISLIVCATVNNHGYISYTIFTYYSSMIAWTMTQSTIDCLTEAMMTENDLTFLPISVNMIEHDELCKRYIQGHVATAKDGYMLCKLVLRVSDKYSMNDENAKSKQKENLAKFLYRFNDIEDDIIVYLYNNNLMNYTWMMSEITGRNFFDTPLVEKIVNKT